MTTIRVIDFETTGTEPPIDEVCEVGICDYQVEAQTISDHASWLCGVKAMPPEVRAVHHIALSDCIGRDPFDPEASGLEANVSAIVAHNASFELKFWKPTLPVICTYKAALRVWPDAPAHNNGALRYWLEDQGKIAIEHAKTQPAHRAGPDAYVTAHILKALFNENVTGATMARWTKDPALLPRCPIGKFRGMKWSEVEAGFLGWMLRQPDMDPDLRWNAEREIARRSGGTE